MTMTTLRGKTRSATRPLPEGTECISGDGTVKAVVAHQNRTGRVGTRGTGGIHIHQEMQGGDGVPTVWSVAQGTRSNDNRDRYEFATVYRVEAAEDAVTIYAIRRYHNKYGGGRGYATTVLTRDALYRVRGEPSHPLTAAQAQTGAIRPALVDGD